MKKIAFVAFFVALSAADGQQGTTFSVKLLAGISTKTSNVGDRFTTFVESPADRVGAFLEGRITKLNAPQRGLGKGKPQIAFEFDTLTVNGQTSLISANLKDITNSTGVMSVDEEGDVIGKSSNMKRILWATAMAGAGAAIGGAVGGGKGAATGALAGTALGVAIGITMTTTGSDISFQPGSHFTLDVYPRRPSR